MKWRWYPVGGVCKRQWPYRHLAAEPVRRARAIVPRGCCRLGTAGLLLQHAAADCWRASAGAWLITWQNVGTWKCKTGWHCTIHQRHLPVVCSSKPTTMKAKKCLLALRTEAWHYMPASWLSLRGKRCLWLRWPVAMIYFWGKYLKAFFMHCDKQKVYV